MHVQLELELLRAEHAVGVVKLDRGAASVGTNKGARDQPILSLELVLGKYLAGCLVLTCIGRLLCNTTWIIRVSELFMVWEIRTDRPIPYAAITTSYLT